MFKQEMPRIDLEALKVSLTAEQFKIAVRIVNAKTGCLRASKPTFPRRVLVEDPDCYSGQRYEYADAEGAGKGCSAYVWRMVAFFASPKAEHHCMPCTCDFNLPGKAYGPEHKALCDRLQIIINAVLDTVPSVADPADPVAPPSAHANRTNSVVMSTRRTSAYQSGSNVMSMH